MPVPQTVVDRHGLKSQENRTGPQKVFVYGTLKKGFGNHDRFLKDCPDLGTATIEGLMFHLGGCPAINLSERFTRIYGEVYEVTWQHITNMDYLEGVNTGFYERIEATVEPHGVVWMYIFNHQRAAREQWLIPSGVWRGGDTPRVKWGGFGKGIEIGTFETNLGAEEIRVGAGVSEFVLRRSPLDNTYKLINKKTREIFGSYTHLRDMIGKDGVQKPVLRLPVHTKPSVDPAVQEVLNRDGRVTPYIPPHQQHPGTSIVWTPEEHKAEEKKEEKPIPQAARLLGVKYGEA